MSPDLKETINTKLAEALDGDFNEQEFLALKRKVEREAEEMDRRADLNLGDTVMEIFGFRRPDK